MSSTQFSVPAVLRRIPNSLVRQLIQQAASASGVSVALDEFPLERIDAGDMDTFLTWCEQQPQTLRNYLDADLRTIFDFASEQGWDALLQAASHLQVDLSAEEEMPDDLPLYGRAAWVLCHHRPVYDTASIIFRVEHLSWWRKRNDLPRRRPDQCPATTRRLKDEISSILRAQGRGYHCTIELLERKGTYYFFVHPDDFAQCETCHNEDGVLMPLVYRRTFELVFAYDPQEGSLEMHAPKIPIALKRELESAFASTILHCDQLEQWSPPPAYQLNHLKECCFQLDVDPADGVRCQITAVRLKPRSGGGRIQIAIDAGRDIHTTIGQWLSDEGFPLSEADVDQAVFRFEFLPTCAAKPGRTTFTVTCPNNCNVRNQQAERVELIRKYLKRWGIDIVVHADTTSVGNHALHV